MLGLKPIKTLPIREKIAANLREAILSKKIPAGEILTLESTAQELGVSITPTREAFQILARDGLLELERNKRAVVLGVNEKTIREHFQVRAAILPPAAMCSIMVAALWSGITGWRIFPRSTVSSPIPS